MRRYIVTFFLIIISFIMQTTVFRFFDFGGITPNFLIILTASYGFMRGDKSGILVGFFCGLLIDVFFGTYIGFFALIYMYIGFVIGFVCYVLMFMFRTRFNIGYYMMHVIVPEIIYTTIVSIFYYPIILRINTKLEEIEQRSAKKFV